MFKDHDSSPDQLRRRDYASLAGILSVGAAVMGLIGYFAPGFPRYLGFIAAFLLGSWAANTFLLLLPPSRARDWIRVAVLLPAEVVMLLIRASMAFGTPVLLVVLLFVVVLGVITFFTSFFADVGSIQWGVLYFAFVITLIIAAYSGDRLLLPLRWHLRIESRESDKELFADAQRALNLINFRRVGYLVTLAVYSAATCVQLIGVKLAPSVVSLLNTSSAALLAFLAVDAYVTAFHPRLLKPREPLRFERSENTTRNSAERNGLGEG
jgi:hypothetical protein